MNWYPPQSCFFWYTYIYVCVHFSACGGSQMGYQQPIADALQHAALDAAQLNYRGAIESLQSVLKQLPTQVQRDTPTDKIYHKLGVYYQLFGLEQPDFGYQKHCSDTAIAYFKKALDIRQHLLGNHWMTCKTRLNIGTLFKDFHQDYVEAQAHFEKSFFTASTDTIGMGLVAPFLEAEILYNWSVSLEFLGDYELAKAHGLRADSVYRALKVWNESDDSNDFQNYLNNLLNLGDIDASLKQPTAIEYFNTIQKIGTKRSIPSDIALTAVLNRGIAMRLKQKLDSAETDLKQAQKLATIRNDSANIHTELAKLYLDKKQFSLAELYALSALNLRNDYPKGHPFLAEIHTVLGQIYLKINQLEKAKKAFQDALGDSQPTNIPKSEIHHPKSAWQIEAASQLADLQSKTDIEGAAKSYQTLSDVLYQRKSFLKTDAAKLNLTQQARTIFSKSISLNRQLHEKTGQTLYLNRILTDMDRSKAVLMSEMIQDSRIQYEGVPNEIRQTERLLRLKVAQAERNLNNNDSLAQQSNLFSKSYQELQTFIQTSEAKYPKYFNFKHQKPQNYDVAQVQKSLPNATGLIHYYLNDNVLHILAIDKSSTKSYELPLTPRFDTAFNRYQRIIAQSKWDWKQNAVFSQASYELYQYLLEKPLADFKNQCTTLITIPDEKLASVSFSALFTAPKMLGEAHDEPYLIKKYALNMAYTISDCGLRIADFGMSGNLHSAIRNPQSAIRNPQSEFVYSGFSHDFKNLSARRLESKVLEILPDSKNHIEKIYQRFVQRGKVYMNNSMTLETFKNIAPKSRITEIISHAGFNENDTRRAVIAFPEADSLNWFDVNTIYNMDWSQNQLIALIACETGKGLPVRGETVMSMSYAFGYAGSRRRISALWSIPHKHSMHLMETFFDHLNQKQMPAVALQKAQIQFLKSGESADQQTPNLWAGLTLSGNIAAIGDTN
jgi:CHAT domain-containing protein/predicted negative regulator of RcsB-dependent stress response